MSVTCFSCYKCHAAGRARRVRPSYLADDAGISRQHLLRLRKGTAEPTRLVMIWLTTAARRILRSRVKITELFDLGDGER
jgi:hypothetical protein